MNTQIIRPPTFQRPSGGLNLGTVQSNLVNGVPTLVELDTIMAGFNDGIENTVTHRITPGRAGFYSIAGNLMLENLIADKYYKVILKVNGTTILQNNFHSSSIDLCGNQISLPSHYFSRTDYAELWAISYAGVDTVDILAGIYTCLVLQRVR